MTKRKTTNDESDAVGRLPYDAEKPPPFGGSWKNLYAAVLVNLLVLVALFYLFTRAFR